MRSKIRINLILYNIKFMSIFKNNLKKIVGIIGGMGPRAGLTLHQKIIDNTKVIKDQDHIPIIHNSFSSLITDRTDYILGKDIETPSLGAMRCIDFIDNSINKTDVDEIIIGIPCNTFHSKPILDPFLFYLNNIPKKKFVFLNMIDLTINYIKNNYPDEKIGLLSTSGTISSNVYLNESKKNNIELVYLDHKINSKINDSIYNQEWGIKKSSNPIHNNVNDIILESINEYKKQNINTVILGCTELPLATNNLFIDEIYFIDPVDILSKNIIYNYYFNNTVIHL